MFFRQAFGHKRRIIAGLSTPYYFVPAVFKLEKSRPVVSNLPCVPCGPCQPLDAEAALPNGFDIEHDNDDADPCHNNIKKLTKGQARQVIKNVPFSSMEYCNGNQIVPLTLAEIRRQNGASQRGM